MDIFLRILLRVLEYYYLRRKKMQLSILKKAEERVILQLYPLFILKKMLPKDRLSKFR